MEFESLLTTRTSYSEIVSELAEVRLRDSDLGILFVSPYVPISIRDIVQAVKAKAQIRNLIGCTCGGIIGSHEEIERQAAAVLVLAKLPQVKILPFMMNQTQLEGFKKSEDWYNFFEVYPSENPIFIALPDPFSFDVNLFLDGLNQAYPGLPVVGGLASAAMSQGENRLVLNEEEQDNGVVGFVLTGDIRVGTVVSQGCRPIGETFIVTKADHNMIHTLAGRPFVEVLQEAVRKLSDRDKLLAQDAIFVGIAMSEYTHNYERGDFLIRGLLGIDYESKAGVVADYIRPGQTIQFHVRDAQSATEDLHELLRSQQLNENERKPKGALVFCCNGRGENLFRQKNHDIAVIQEHVGLIPAAGFFCAGEIGPVGKNNFLHGFTNSIALFYPREK